MVVVIIVVAVDVVIGSGGVVGVVVVRRCWCSWVKVSSEVSFGPRCPSTFSNVHKKKWGNLDFQ